MTPFAAGLDADEPDTMVWRGFKVPVPTQPLYYLEENPSAGENWIKPEGSTMAARTGGKERSEFVQCVIDNGGASKFEVQSMEPKAKDALIAAIKTKCGGMEGNNWADADWLAVPSPQSYKISNFVH